MLLLQLVLVVLLVPATPFMIPSLSDVWKLAKFGSEIGTKIKEGYDIYEQNADDANETINEMLQQLAELSTQIDDFESQLNHRLNSTMEIEVTGILQFQNVDITLQPLDSIIVNIDLLWDKYLEDFRNRTSFNSTMIEEFIQSATGSQQGGLRSLLSQMRELIFPLSSDMRDNLFQTMRKHDPEVEFIGCDQGNSRQQAIYQTYYSVVLTELRGFVMTAYAYGLRFIFDKEKYIDEVDALEARLVLRTQGYLLATKEAMELASNMIYRCDPPDGHKKGQTFVEMDELFQTYVVNEADIHPDDSCKSDCESIGTQTFRWKRASWKNYNYNKTCTGKITGCRYGGGSMQICNAAVNDSRRYHWFTYDDGIIAGDNTNCPGLMYYPIGWSSGFYRCDYCICTCDADASTKSAKRAISFLPSQSDTQNNWVLTGIRLVQEQGMIHIQIREGKLQPQGRILKNSDRWVPLPEFHHYQAHDQDVYYVKRGLNLDEQQLGISYGVIHGQQRAVNLDDVSVKKNHIIIGARLRYTPALIEEKYPPICLQVLTMPFDYETGKVSDTLWTSNWWSKDSETERRQEVQFNEPDNPLRYYLNLPTTGNKLYVKFRETDVRKDAGQSTIPFWDIQEVVTSPSSPVGGIGLFHKGHKDGLSGGYLALRLHSFNFADYLNDTLPETMQTAYQKHYNESLYLPTDDL